MDKKLLDVYVNSLDLSDNEQCMIRNSVLEFCSLFADNGKSLPNVDDYEVYTLHLKSKGESQDLISESVQRVKNFFAYVADQEDTHSQTSADKNHSIEKNSRRFSLIFQPATFEELEWLAKYDKCSVSKIVLNACNKYIDARQDDINYIRNAITAINLKIEQRKNNQDTQNDV